MRAELAVLDVPLRGMDNKRPFGKSWGNAGMWVSKPIYESLPYFYLSVGAIALLASMYLNHWYWPTICFVVGIASLVGGLVLFLKRRDYRHSDHRNHRLREE